MHQAFRRSFGTRDCISSFLALVVTLAAEETIRWPRGVSIVHTGNGAIPQPRKGCVDRVSCSCIPVYLTKFKLPFSCYAQGNLRYHRDQCYLLKLGNCSPNVKLCILCSLGQKIGTLYMSEKKMLRMSLSVVS